MEFYDRDPFRHARAPLCSVLVRRILKYLLDKPEVKIGLRGIYVKLLQLPQSSWFIN